VLAFVCNRLRHEGLILQFGENSENGRWTVLPPWS
jgi:hypothetical protein